MNHEATKKNNKRAIFDIELSKIKPNPFQPRIHFDDTKLESLANSIRLLLANALSVPLKKNR